MNVASLYNSLLAAKQSGVHPLNGVNYDRLALGIAQSICQWGIGQPQNLGLTGQATGMSGTGSVPPNVSRITVVSNPVIMRAALVGAGVAGPVAQSLATAVSNGVANAFTADARYTGSVIGVGSGVDVSRFSVVNAATLIPILTQVTLGGGGLSLPAVALGLGNGIAQLLLLGVGVGTVVGTPTVPSFPSVGITSCVVV